ncbi:MAG: hypothetical protein Q4G02_01310 [bacterium]|nr:hypothetical protein [bacterium]
MADNLPTNNFDALQETALEVMPEALDKGEAGQTDTPEQKNEQTPASPEQHENPITGELGKRMLNWYETYALPHSQDQSLGLAVNKDQFVWQLGNDERITINELDQALTNEKTGLITRYRTLSSQSETEAPSKTETEVAEGAVEHQAAAPEDLDPEEKQKKENDIARQLLDVLTERFFAELAYMTQVARGLEQAVAQADQNQDRAALQTLETKLTQASKDIFTPFLVAAGEDKTGARFGQATFFDRYRDYKERDQDQQMQTYQTDLQEWQRRFDKTRFGNDYVLKEQTQSLENTFLNAFQELQFLVGGNNGEGGIPAALRLIQEKLAAPEQPIQETTATAPTANGETEVVQTDEITDEEKVASAAAVDLPNLDASTFAPAAGVATEKITPVGKTEAPSPSTGESILSALLKTKLTDEKSDQAPIQDGVVEDSTVAPAVAAEVTDEVTADHSVAAETSEPAQSSAA